MENILPFIKTHKIFIVPLIGIIIFLLIRTVVLQKPDTELTYLVKQENLVDTVQVSGTYTTASQTTVTSPASGVISQLYVTNGESVTKGQALFHVTSTATTDQQNAAYADYTNALSTLQTAENNAQSLDAAMWTKQQAYIAAQDNQNYMNNNTTNPTTKQSYTDLEKFAINNAITQTQKDFQAAEHTYQTAGVTVTAAQAKVTQTKQAYAETQSATVTAPASGKIVNLEDQVGDSVTAPSSAITIAGSSTGQASITSSTPDPVLVIANLSDPYITTAISEDYAARVMSGQKTSMVFDSLKDKTFTGTVQSIDTVGTNRDGIVTYNARIVTNDLTANIRPNMTALITIETLRKDNVIDVPNSAIITKGRTTYVQQAKTHTLFPVAVGTKGLAKTEITSGLPAGTVIVASPEE
jgi:multidrug efflux pump subunit AcrA (membrane-fusion protein)